VRPLLHGRQSGRLRPRTHLGRNQDHARQRHHHQAQAPDERSVLRRRADLSPYFLDAVAYSRKVGYNSVQAASNGIEFAKSKELCRAAAEAGLRYVYLQFDGIGNAANSHRKVGNLFDVKLQAIHNLHEAGVEIVPVTTIINGINNEQVGRIIQFASTIPRPSASSASSQSALPAATRTSATSAVSPSATPSPTWPTTSKSSAASASRSATGSHQLHEHLLRLGRPDSRPAAEWGQLSCGCHPNCGIGMALMIDKETRKPRPSRLPEHEQGGQGPGQGQRRGPRQVALRHRLRLASLRNYDPFKSPPTSKSPT